MIRVRVKFCGITSARDAEKAVAVGADALGFVFFKESPRYISPKDAGDIIRRLPPYVSAVGVFVNEDLGFIEECVERYGLNAVQLHGDEDVKYCLGFKSLRFKGIKLIKAIRVKDKESLDSIEECPADAFLLDAYISSVYGGTGKGFDRTLAVLAKEYDRRIIISGGLTSDNVYDIVKEIRPYAVDVSSGIESSPGKKNVELMEEFIKEVRRAEED
ncbi:MAG: phosphoribosylanthranilate isomerase [Candidatus Gorgyraea atricola]|nr:phosphoribosylanthranilate isomerase [Candidatus Gorgyraea atricola]